MESSRLSTANQTRRAKSCTSTARKRAQSFQDPIAFIKRGGVKGIQLLVLPPIVADSPLSLPRFNREGAPWFRKVRLA
jgi:hypothetical protein